MLGNNVHNLLSGTYKSERSKKEAIRHCRQVVSDCPDSSHPDVSRLETEALTDDEIEVNLTTVPANPKYVSAHLPRKLAAILHADVAGYSRLMGEDEDETHRILSDYLDLIAAIIESHHGQVMHYAGDAVLAQFPAVLDAVSSAVVIQDELQGRNAALPEEHQVRFRIGVNVGDVIEDRGDIYGEGVNVTARLEALAEAGGICISDSVRTVVGRTLPYRYAFMGEQNVKNIEEPVRAYRVFEQGASPAPLPHNVEARAGTTFQPSGKPCLAIKPFTHIGADPEQDYFADGLAADIVTALVKTPELCLVMNDSPSEDRSQQLNDHQLGHQCGVQYVLKGNVRKHGHRVRVNAELVEAGTGRHLWAERYDRELGDQFTIQDEITEEIVATMGVKFVVEDSAQLEGKAIKTPAGRRSTSTSMTIPRTIRRMVFTAADVTKAALFRLRHEGRGNDEIARHM